MNPAILAGVVIAALGLLYLLNGGGGQFDAQSAMYLTSDQITSIVAATSVQNKTFAQAVAVGEGYQDASGNVLSQNIPAQAHNPLDLVLPGWTGAKLGEGISVFISDAEGWARGYNELNLIASGKSSVYSLSDTISSMAAKWTTTQAAAWAANVSAYLGVSADTPLSQLLA